MRIRETTGIEFSWHKCRHTYANHLIRNDVDLETIRQMLGHEGLSTTQVYSVMDNGEAMQRIKSKAVKFFESVNSSKPWYCTDGLEGN